MLASLLCDLRGGWFDCKRVPKGLVLGELVAAR